MHINRTKIKRVVERAVENIKLHDKEEWAVAVDDLRRGRESKLDEHAASKMARLSKHLLQICY